MVTLPFTLGSKTKDSPVISATLSITLRISASRKLILTKSAAIASATKLSERIKLSDHLRRLERIFT